MQTSKKNTNMNQKDILYYVGESSLIIQEVFSSIKNSKNKSTRNSAITVGKSFVERLNESITKDKKQYLHKTSLEEFMIFANELDGKTRQSIQYKLFTKPFTFLIIPILAFIFDLNAKKIFELKEIEDEAYYEVGDAILLAGLYFLFEEI
jgi:hypothetical protein